MTTNSIGQLAAEYRGARIRVEFDATPSARLYINNMMRQERAAESGPRTFVLTSPVQTDYEWHEYIDALVRITEEGASISISTGGKAIASRDFNPAWPGKGDEPRQAIRHHNQSVRRDKGVPKVIDRRPR